MIAFRVHGVAQPKGNMKAYTPRGMKFPIVTERNTSVRSWSQLVAEGANAALNNRLARDGSTRTGCELQLGPVRVRLDFVLPRPKALGHKPAPHLKAPDADKLARAVLDALTGVLYRDDAQVVDLQVTKAYADLGAAPYCDVRVDAAGGFHAAAIRGGTRP